MSVQSSFYQILETQEQYAKTSDMFKYQNKIT